MIVVSATAYLTTQQGTLLGEVTRSVMVVVSATAYLTTQQGTLLGEMKGKQTGCEISFSTNHVILFHCVHLLQVVDVQDNRASLLTGRV